MVDKNERGRSLRGRRDHDPVLDLVVAGDAASEFIVAAVEAHPSDLVRVVTEKFGISRQAVHQRLSGLIRDGLIQASGQTRSRRYALGPVRKRIVALKVTADLDEDRIWTELVKPQLTGLPQNVVSICRYGVTEMLNNVVDHSESREATVAIKRTPRSIDLHVQDRGVGIFHKIKTECGLASEHEALLELTKGKLTTDPEHHTGEGIFFASRMFDDFTIGSGTVLLLCLAAGETWSFEAREAGEGTFVGMQISPESRRTTQEVFERFASAKGGFSFDRTRLVVRLVEPEGERAGIALAGEAHSGEAGAIQRSGSGLRGGGERDSGICRRDLPGVRVQASAGASDAGQ